jgi:hypothetical protein
MVKTRIRLGFLLLGVGLQADRGLDRVQVGALDVLDQGFADRVSGRERDLDLFPSGDLGSPESTLAGDEVKAAVVLLLHLDRLNDAGVFDGLRHLFQLFFVE